MEEKTLEQEIFIALFRRVGLSQRAFGREVGKSQQNIWKHIHGLRGLNFTKLQAMAAKFGLTIEIDFKIKPLRDREINSNR